MNRLNADGHDKSQYLPRGTPPVNPFRAQHKGIEWDGESIKVKTWMPDILLKTLDEFGKEMLTRDQVHTCESMFRAITATRNSLGINDLRAFIGESKGDGEPKDIFFAVIHGLLPYQANLCLWVVCDEYNRGNLPLAKKLITNIQQSIDLAQILIDNL